MHYKILNSETIAKYEQPASWIIKLCLVFREAAIAVNFLRIVLMVYDISYLSMTLACML